MKIIVQPVIEPVQIADVKAQLGILTGDTASDAIIASRITEARQFIEWYTRRALNTQTLEIRMNSFCEYIELPSPPILSVVSVKYIDNNGVLQTVASSDYVLDDYPMVPFIRYAYGLSWPSPRDERNAVRVQYTAGYGPLATDVPQLLREALMLIIGHWMNFQQQSENGLLLSRIPYAVRDILDQYAVVRYT